MRTFKGSKASFTRWILVLFILTLVVSGAGSVFFQAPANSNQELNEYRSLFSIEDIKSIEQITLTNRLGEFTFNKLEDSESWRMSSPRSVMANSVPLNRILEALQNLKIKKIFERDAITVSNFSIENPLVTLKLKEQNGESQKLFFGLLNPMDNTTYLMFETGEVIFHIEAVGFTLESLDLASFIDSRVFPVSPDQIKSFKVFRGKNSSPQLTLTREDNKWLNSSQKALGPNKVEEYLKELASLRSLFIIDEKTQELESALERYLSNPAYTIEVENQEGKSFTYTLSHIINSLPQIKTEGRQNFIIQSSARDYPFLLGKEALPLFNKRDNSFKKLGIDEIFY